MSDWVSIGDGHQFTYTELIKDENNQLKAENEKLRELVRLAYDCATSGVSCRDCDLVFGEGSCQLKAELENMGIEVDDGTE